MKLLAILLLMTTQAFAQTFTTSETVSAKTSNYENPKTINLEIIDLNVYTRSATIKMNDEIVTKKVRLTNEDIQASSAVYTYELVKSVLLSDGYACDRHESMDYKITITVTKSNNSQAQNEVSNVKLTHFYAWDICHDPGDRVVETINYTKL